jgi:hypothetical protein
MSKHPSSEYVEEARTIIQGMNARELTYSAKKGDILGVEKNLAGASKDIRSEALMEAVWGLLHTSKEYRQMDPAALLAEREAMMRSAVQAIESDPDMSEDDADRKLVEALMRTPSLQERRTSDVAEETYIEIIRALLEAKADPRRFAYADFASNEVQAYQDRAKEEEFKKGVADKGHGTIATSFGASELSGTYVDYGAGGLSIQQIAEIHKADKLIAMLRRYD